MSKPRIRVNRDGTFSVRKPHRSSEYYLTKRVNLEFAIYAALEMTKHHAKRGAF